MRLIFLLSLHLQFVIGSMKAIFLADSPSHFIWSWWQLPLVVIIVRGIIHVAKTLPKYPPPPNLNPATELSSRESSMPTPISNQTERKGILMGGYACAVASIFILPPFLGLAGVICGLAALKRQQTSQGIAVVIVSFVCAAIGMILGDLNTSPN